MHSDLNNQLPWLKEVPRPDMNRAIEALYRVHGLMAALTDLDTLLERISEEARIVARAQAASVILFDERSDELYFFVALGDSGDQEALKREVRLKRGQGIAGTAALERTTLHVPDVDKDPRFYRGADETSQFRTRNILAVPMIERNQLVGVLELLNKEGDSSFSLLDQRVMEMFSAVAASAVVNARLIEQQIKNERLAAIGQAIAGLTHHIKNILTGLSSSAELIDMAFDSGNEKLVKKTWPALRRSIQRISNLVQDLLVFAKPRKPFLQTCDPQRVLVDACETMHDFVEKKGVRVELNIAETVGPISADPEGLFRCLMNLLSNALDAVPNNEGMIKISLDNPTPEWLEIQVADNGPGIPPEMREKVFEVFVSTKGTRGTGIGLACAAKIIQEHEGDLTLLDRTGGACFRVMLPVRNTINDAVLQEEA